MPSRAPAAKGVQGGVLGFQIIQIIWQKLSARSDIEVHG
jgi:hypothetical protein